MTQTVLLAEQALAALTCLDADRLEEVALDLEALLFVRIPTPSLEELVSRQRVFAGVLRATHRNLAVLTRLQKERSGGRSSEGVLWGH